MEGLVARYLDGELSVEEAETLLRAAENDPRVDAALREYETMLEAARGLPQLRPPGGLGDRVLAEIDRRKRETLRPRTNDGPSDGGGTSGGMNDDRSGHR